MNKIKVLEVIGDSTLSGAPRHLLSLVKGLNKKRFDITCVCPPGPLAGELEEINGVDVEIIKMHSKWDFGVVRKIRKIISHLSSQSSSLIVHCHGMRGGYLGRLACIVPKDKAPKVIYTEHLWTFEYKLKNPFSNFFQLCGLWFLDLFTNKTIAVSKAVAVFLTAKNITRPSKIEIIYNGVKAQEKRKKKKEKISVKDSEFTLGFVGSLNKQKGIEYLLRALPEVSSKLTFAQRASAAKAESQNLKLIIVGEGEEKENLINLSKKLKIDKQIKFLGMIDDLSSIYPTLDIYVQPSVAESFGISALEALSFGVPVVASAVGGLPELLNGVSDKSDFKPYQLTKCGVLVLPQNAIALSLALAKILKNDKLRKKMSAEAIKKANQFSLDKMIDETENLYESILA